MFEIKKGLTDIWPVEDYFYQLTDGGHFPPKNILEHKEDIDKVEEAIKVLEKYRDTLYAMERADD